jgi:hypothetical protein
MKYFYLFIFFVGAAIPGLAQRPDEAVKLESTYDASKQETTVRLPPVKLSGDKEHYHSLHMSPAFKYSGVTPARPRLIDFELQIVVKGRLKTDLYVLFVLDQEKIFLSSNRSAVVRPVPGRVWMGERLVFRMPYETLLKIAAGKKLEIRMDAVTFAVSEEHLSLIRAFAEQVKALPN